MPTWSQFKYKAILITFPITIKTLNIFDFRSAVLPQILLRNHGCLSIISQNTHERNSHERYTLGIRKKQEKVPVYFYVFEDYTSLSYLLPADVCTISIRCFWGPWSQTDKAARISDQLPQLSFFSIYKSFLLWGSHLKMQNKY